MSSWPQTLALVGAGKMGAALLNGWLAGGLPADRVFIVEPAPARAIVDLAARTALRLNPRIEGLKPPDALVFAVKPQAFAAAAETARPLAGADTLVLSIMAGKRISDIASRLPQAKTIVRAMPNLPASVGRGV